MAAWIIIALIIIGIIIWVASQSNDDPTDSASPSKKARLTFLEKLSKRIREIQCEIAAQMEVLKLTIEMQRYLDRKLNRILIAAKLVSGILLLSPIVLLMMNGLEFWTAILTVSTFVCLGVPVLTFFFFKKVMDVRELINWSFKKIKDMVHKRFGCDSTTIYLMQNEVAAKQLAVEVLHKEIVNQQTSKVTTFTTPYQYTL